MSLVDDPMDTSPAAGLRWSGMDADDSLFLHRQRLLQRRRCPHCAERVPARAILRGEACSKCGQPLTLANSGDHAQDVLDAVREGWNQARVPVYAAVLIAAFLAGWVPWLGTAVTAVAMVLANVLLIRRPLQWLAHGRRMATRFLLRLWLVALVLASLALNTLAAPLIAAFGAGAVIAGFVGLATTFLYVEGALLAVERGIRAQST